MGEQPQVIIIAGPNGAGKSTLAPVLLRDTFELRDYVNADPIAHGLSGFDPASMAFEAGRIMLKRIQRLAKERKSFGLESTLSARFYAGWIEGLVANDYRFELMFLWLRSPELAVQRVRERVLSGGHDVPEAIIRRRYVSGLRNFWTLYRPLANGWAVYDNSVTFGATPIASGGKSRGLLVLDRDAWISFSATKP